MVAVVLVGRQRLMEKREAIVGNNFQCSHFIIAVYLAYLDGRALVRRSQPAYKPPSSSTRPSEQPFKAQTAQPRSLVGSLQQMHYLHDKTLLICSVATLCY